MDTNRNLEAFADPNWIEALLQECEDEVRMEARWPTLLLQSTGRRMIWNISAILGVNGKGVPGSACRLLERYLSSHIRSFLQESRDNEEWERYKDMLTSRFYLLMVSCVQLAAKMSDLLAPLSASMVRTTLMKEGIEHTKGEIVEMEFHVYSTLNFRLPLWTTLEISEFLANQIGLKEPQIMEAVGLVIHLTEFYRDVLEMHMKCWVSCNTPGSSSSTHPNRVSLHNLHVSAGAVAAAARYMRSSLANPAQLLATLVRSSPAYIKAISYTILNYIIPDKSHIAILKKRRLR